MHLARCGQIKVVLGGPPCRTFSRLRHQRPGPKPLRGRGEKRWRLEDLTDEEVDKTHGDTALVLKMMAIYDVVVEASPEFHAFLMEHPTDPKDYLYEAEQYPSIWKRPEVHDFAQRHGLQTVKLDQGACGHSRVTPTTLLTDLEAMKELDGLRANGAKEEIELNLGPRMRQTSTWSAWAPGLVRAIQLAIMELQDAIKNPRLRVKIIFRKALCTKGFCAEQKCLGCFPAKSLSPYVCMYVFMCVCMYVCMYVRTYVRMYVCM